MSGWYKSKRGTLEHPLFKPDGPFSRFEAWHWLIEHAAFRPQQVDVHGQIVAVPRGSLCITLRALADEWSWTVKRLRTFLDRLEREGTIHRKVVGNENGTSKGTTRTLITLCNYSKYQGEQASEGTSEGIVGAQQGHIKEEGKNTSVAKATGDPAALVFGQVRAWLAEATGKSDAAVRRILGGWAKDHSHGEIIDACARAKREGAIDPVAFVNGIWAQRRKPDDRRNLTVDEDLERRGFRELHPPEDNGGNFSGGGHHSPPPARNAAHDLPGVLPFPAQEDRPVPERDVQAGRGGLELLALRA